jgi:glycerophosphoryl diester phosphodiesterase
MRNRHSWTLEGVGRQDRLLKESLFGAAAALGLVLVLGVLGACQSNEEGAPTMEVEHRVQIVGHRGAKGVAPENTLVSFQAALDEGVDMIELDVHLSTDGELVVIHDPRLERTTDGSGLVGDFTLEDLKKLDASAKFEGDAWSGVQRIPTLQEVYDLVQGQVEINVEIKTAEDGSRYPGIEDKVVALARENDALAYTVVSSFDFPTVQEVLSLEPEMACYAIVSTDYFREMGLKGKRANDAVADLVAHGFSQVAVNKQYLSKDLMSLLADAGFVVGVWVLNDVDEMWAFMELGVDRVTTDRPDLLIAAIQEAEAVRER